MDYGVMLKKTHPNPSRKSAHHQRQSKFAGSNRQVRGMIIKLLTESPQLSEEEVIKKLRVFSARIKENFVQLIKEGLIKKKGQKFMIA